MTRSRSPSMSVRHYLEVISCSKLCHCWWHCSLGWDPWLYKKVSWTQALHFFPSIHCIGSLPETPISTALSEYHSILKLLWWNRHSFSLQSGKVPWIQLPWRATNHSCRLGHLLITHIDWKVLRGKDCLQMTEPQAKNTQANRDHHDAFERKEKNLREPSSLSCHFLVSTVLSHCVTHQSSDPLPIGQSRNSVI